MALPNFKIEMLSTCNPEDQDEVVSKRYYVVSADDNEMATQIAQAIIGIEVGSGEYLEEILSVNPTAEKLSANFYSNERQWWDIRQEVDPELKFVCDEIDRIVGLTRS